MASEAFIYSIPLIIFFTLILVYSFTGAYIEKKNLIVGHETTIVLVIALIASLVVHLYDPDGNSNIRTVLEFNEAIFFYVCLPPIIFASGFNMRRKKFFANIGYILLFGILGTLVTFIVFGLLTYGFIATGKIMIAQKGEE